ncbi:MAG TPA: TetR family transcriptional regulator [Fulvivirga sp.]|nr:TetR family transcriptional regulator [Fulvivirga sp.]
MSLNDKQIQILAVAEELIAKNGFDGTSVRDIAKAAKVNIAMISYYFGSKDKLLEALFLYRISDFRMVLETVLSQDLSFFEMMDEIVALTIKRIHKNRRIHKIVNFEFSNGTRDIDFDLYVNQKKENLLVIDNFIKKGQEEGVFNKNVNIQMLTPTILGTYFHFYYNKRFYQSLLELEDDQAIDNYVHTTLTQHVQQTIKAVLTNEK